MDVITERNGLDLSKPWMLKSARQDDMTVQPARPGSNLREGHARLKGDTGLLWEDSNRADLANSCYNLVE